MIYHAFVINSLFTIYYTSFIIHYKKHCPWHTCDRAGMQL